jgi:dTDP-4-dehydrorhamnose 3,5-epimerase-like enzyme
MLKGIEIKALKKFADERGFFTEIMRRYVYMKKKQKK